MEESLEQMVWGEYLDACAKMYQKDGQNGGSREQDAEWNHSSMDGPIKMTENLSRHPVASSRFEH